MMRKTWRNVVALPGVNGAITTTGRTVCRVIGMDPQPFMDHIPRVGSVATRLPNGRRMRLRAERGEAYANHVYWRGWSGPEPATAPVFWDLAQKARVVVDVGAHVGYYSLLAAFANPSARVYSFEPLPHVARRLRAHVEMNGTAGVSVRQQALGAVAGRQALYYSAAIPVPSASTLRPDHFPETNTATTEVDVVTLDELRSAGQLPHVDLIKLDVEGLEPEVLLGGQALLASDKPALLLEVLPESDTAHRLNDTLTPLGYRFTPLGGLAEPQRSRIEPISFDVRNWLATPR